MKKYIFIPLFVLGALALGAAPSMSTQNVRIVAPTDGGNPVSVGIAASGNTVKVSDGTDTALVSGTGALNVTCDNCGGASPFEDNDAFTPNTSAVSVVGFEVDDTATTAALENSAGAARMTTQRSVHMNLRSGASEIGILATPLRTDPTGTTTQPVSGTLTCNLAAGVNNIGDVDVLTMPNVTIGTFPDNEPINVAQINGVTPLMGTGATGTGSQRVTLATNSPGFSTANGAIAADSVLTANRAVTYGSSPTAVTAGNHAPAIADLEGIPYVNNGHPRAVFCQMAAGTGTTLAELTGCAAVASNSYYVNSVIFTGGIATAATIPALLRSGTGANCGTATTTWATCWHTTASDCTFYFDPPIKITQGHALCHIDATVGTKSLMLTGYIAP